MSNFIKFGNKVVNKNNIQDMTFYTHKYPIINTPAPQPEKSKKRRVLKTLFTAINNINPILEWRECDVLKLAIKRTDYDVEYVLLYNSLDLHKEREKIINESNHSNYDPNLPIASDGFVSNYAKACCEYISEYPSCYYIEEDLNQLISEL